MNKWFEGFKNFFSEWQELLIWIPVTLGLVVLAYFMIPYVDPRSGIDGFGDLFLFMNQVVKLAVVFFMVWLFKRTYWNEFTIKEENDLHNEASHDLKDTRNARWVLIKDRIEWVVLLVVIGYFLLD